MRAVVHVAAYNMRVAAQSRYKISSTATKSALPLVLEV